MRTEHLLVLLTPLRASSVQAVGSFEVPSSSPATKQINVSVHLLRRRRVLREFGGQPPAMVEVHVKAILVQPPQQLCRLVPIGSQKLRKELDVHPLEPKGSEAAEPIEGFQLMALHIEL